MGELGAQSGTHVQGSSDDFPRSKRFVFVQLLFSLTAAEIARESADLVTRKYALMSAPASWAQLVLALIVVATSWIGWSGSKASKRIKAERVFSFAFLALLTDVVLVVFYFILVRSAEIPKEQVPRLQEIPSAYEETFWSAIILSGYFFWDVLSKGIIAGEGDHPRVWHRLISSTLWKRGWISFLCCFFAWIVYALFRETKKIGAVIMIDASLISLFLLFRAFKEERPRIGIGILVTTTVLLIIACRLS